MALAAYCNRMGKITSIHIALLTTPCPTTSAAVLLMTVTVLPTTLTVPASATTTQSNTIQTTVTSFTTIEDTLTTTIYITAQETTSITIATTTTAAQPLVRKRADVYIKPLPVIPSGLLNARAAFAAAVTTCTPITKSPSSVPTYASACSGTVRYSSACSCAGITAAATTIPQSTVVVRSVSTIYFTPIVTTTSTSTQIAQETILQIQTVPATIETTAATTVITTTLTTETSTSTILTTSTVVPVTPASCYKFVATNGPFTGQFITGETPDANIISYGFVSLTSSTRAMNFRLKSNGRVYGGNNIYGWTSDSSDLYYVLQVTDASFTRYSPRLEYLTCIVGNGDSTFVGAAGMLSCSVDGQLITLSSCSGLANYLVKTTPGTNSGDCTPVNLAAIPVAGTC